MSVAGAPAERARRRLTMGLSLKFALAFIGLVSLVLIVNGAVNMWISYDEAKRAAVRVQQEKAEAAAERIEQFVAEIERQIGWTTHAQWSAGTIDQRRYDFVRLLRQVPAITELVQIDGAGKEQLKVSRLAMDVVGSGTDLSADPRFAKAVADKVWFSPVYFRKESEPYMTISVAHVGRNAGVTVAEVNLKFIWDVVTSIKIGQAGYAYVVNGQGRLIAHPDISLVLRDTDLSGLSQVAGALAALRNHEPPASTAATATGPDGASVLTAYAAIPRLDWLVFVELPRREAMAPVYASLTQTGVLLGLGLLLAAVAGAWLARRMAVPIRRLQAGAERLGSGELDHRIEIRTSDEIEVLADRFNRMGAQLQESYATLEAKVATRTHDLAEALDHSTATAEVLQVINSSPGDLGPVFEAILQKAHSLCDVAYGSLQLYDGSKFRAVAVQGISDALADRLRQGYAPGPNMPNWRLLEGARFAQVDDIGDIDDPVARATAELSGIRTTLFIPLRKEEALLGQIVAARREVKLFTEKEIALLESFAAQAVIAIENARLLGETREALEQQTATADVLKLISRSTFDLQPVLDTLAENAVRLCGAEMGTIWRLDGNVYQRAGSYGFSKEYRKAFPSHPGMGRGTLLGRTVLEGRVVQIVDVSADPEYTWSEAVAPSGIRSMLGVPLMREGVPVGVFSLHRKEVQAFTNNQIALVTTFADQAVIAIENARLLGELRTRNDDLAESLEQQTVTGEVLKVISRSTFDLAPVFETLAENAVRLCAAERAVIFRFDGKVLRAVASYNASPEFRQHVEEHPVSPGRHSVSARAALERRTVQIPDAQADPEYSYVRFDVDPIRTVLAVPMLKGDELVGVIAIWRLVVKPFTDKQIALVTIFADQAVIAIENARLLAELRTRNSDLAEALEFQTATSEVLRIVASSPDDLQSVFDAMLEKAAALCAAHFGFLALYDGGAYRFVAGKNLPGPLERAWRTEPQRPGPNTALLRLTQIKAPVHIEDVRDDIAYLERDPLRVAAVELGGARAQLGIPLLKRGELIGALIIYRQEPRRFTDNQIALVTNFADQAVIAIENARLLGELRERSAELARSVAELTTLREVGEAVSSTLDLTRVLETIVARAVALGGAEAGAIYRYRKSDRQFRFGTFHGFDAELAARIREAPILESETFALARTIQQRAPAQIPDLEAAPHLPLRDLMVAAGFRSVLMVPLLAADRVFGVLSIQKKTVGEFPESAVNLMQTFASQSALAIQNARLFREVEEQGRALAIASQHKSQFLANMSHELRTPLNAVLGYAELLADGIYGELSEKARGVLERIQTNGKHLLGLINDVLDLSKIEAGQLSLAIEDYAMPAVVHSVVSATEPLAKAKGLTLVTSVPRALPMGRGDERRLTQVLLNLVGNAIKFTDKGSVGIDVALSKDRFELAVKDTGPGIAKADQARIFEEFQQVDNSSTRQKGGTGLGLAISKRIVEMHGGRLTVDSEPGKGSTFRVTVPVQVEPVKEIA